MYRSARRLQQLRKDKGWTQALAAREIGIQQSYLSKLENGKFLPSEEVCEKIAAAYDVDTSELSEHLNSQNTATQTIDMISLCMLCFSLTLFVTAYFELFFSQHFYTYQFDLPAGIFNEMKPGFFVTQEYMGERFVHPTDQLVYELIGERSVMRKENNWLYAIALLNLILSLFRLGMKRYT